MSVIGEERHLLDLLFFAEFTQKITIAALFSSESLVNVGFVRYTFDGGVQSTTFVDPNHCLVNCNVIRFCVTARLSIGLLRSVVNGGSTELNT